MRSSSSKPQAVAGGEAFERRLYRLAIAENCPIFVPGSRGNAQMAEPAIRGMTVDEFLCWEDGTDTRYELVDGYVVAMAPPAPAHGRLAARLAGVLDATLRGRPPCAVQSEAGIIRPDRNDLCYVADLAVSC